jgi:hypothetical protein
MRDGGASTATQALPSTVNLMKPWGCSYPASAIVPVSVSVWVLSYSLQPWCASAGGRERRGQREWKRAALHAFASYSRCSTQPRTDLSAAGSADGSVPPACAMSARRRPCRRPASRHG